MAALVIRNESRRGRLVQTSIQIQRYRRALQLMSVGVALSCTSQHAIHFSWWSCSRFATAPCRIVARDSNCSSTVHDEPSAHVICACVVVELKMSGLSGVRSSAKLIHTGLLPPHFPRAPQRNNGPLAGHGICQANPGRLWPRL